VSSLPAFHATVDDLLADAEARLRAAEADAPELSALVLLEHATGERRERLLAQSASPIPFAVAQRFDDLVARRAAREPLAYIVGHREFFGREFLVTPVVLIPRPETEGLVELALAYYHQRRAAWLYPLALDVGTGSGAIAVSLLAEIPTMHVVATDALSMALGVARRNATHHAVEERLHLVACDLASALTTEFDLIVANLPYVASGDIVALQPEVRDYEPRLALDGGVEGTLHITRFLNDLPRLLRQGGVAILEIGEDQGPRLAMQFARAFPGWAVGVQPDAYGAARYLAIERPQ
jgi:release factor glutamine methyltransferase